MQTEQNAFGPLEIAARNGIGKTSVYKAIADGALKARKLGARTIITAADEKSWLDSLPAFSPKTEAA